MPRSNPWEETYDGGGTNHLAVFASTPSGGEKCPAGWVIHTKNYNDTVDEWSDLKMGFSIVVP